MLTVNRADAATVIPLRASVLRPGRPLTDAMWACDDVSTTQHWAAELDGQTVGVATVVAAPFPEGVGPNWQLRGMAVDATWRSRGVGRVLLERVMNDVAAPIWCNARILAAPFYQRNGWKIVSPEFEIAGIGPHVRMVTA
jgi:GNAT superfamily N-acetyltransferase